jgi:spermidine synthase
MDVFVEDTFISGITTTIFIAPFKFICFAVGLYPTLEGSGFYAHFDKAFIVAFIKIYENMDTLGMITELITGDKEVLSIRKKHANIALLENTYTGNKVVKYNGIVYSRFNKKSIFTHSYWDYFLPLAYIYKNPKILLIGLGGGTMIMQLKTLFGNEIDLDVVESNIDMVKIAERSVPGIGKNTVICDGAKYVEEKICYYDLVFLDAYDDLNIPDQFLSEKFVVDVDKAMKNDGILAINYAMTFASSPKLDELINKLRTRFAVYKVGNIKAYSNIILIGSKHMAKEEIIEKIKNNMKIDSENSFLINAYEELSEA